jgi:hypothetical protein
VQRLLDSYLRRNVVEGMRHHCVAKNEPDVRCAWTQPYKKPETMGRTRSKYYAGPHRVRRGQHPGGNQGPFELFGQCLRGSVQIAH